MKHTTLVGQQQYSVITSKALATIVRHSNMVQHTHYVANPSSGFNSILTYTIEAEGTTIIIPVLVRLPKKLLKALRTNGQIVYPVDKNAHLSKLSELKLIPAHGATPSTCTPIYADELRELATMNLAITLNPKKHALDLKWDSLIPICDSDVEVLAACSEKVKQVDYADMSTHVYKVKVGGAKRYVSIAYPKGSLKSKNRNAVTPNDKSVRIPPILNNLAIRRYNKVLLQTLANEQYFAKLMQPM